MKTSILLDRNSFARAQEELHNDPRGLKVLAAQVQAAKNLPALLSAAEELHKAMILHFVHEERPGGLYDSLRFCVPQHSRELAELAGAHHDIAVAVWQLCQRAHEPKARLQALRKEAAEVVQKLLSHEKREHEMARQALISLDRNLFARAEEELHNDHLWLERFAGLLQAAKDLPALLSAAEELRKILILHFAHEEHPGGLYDSLKFCVPQHRKKLTELLEAHHDITVAAWMLYQRAHDSKANIQALRNEAAQLVRKLQFHERSEHAMARYALIPLDQNSFAQAEEELRNEHRWLERFAAVLQAAKDLPALLSAAEELRKALILHFAHEEHPGGLYDSLKFYLPQHGKEREQLLEAHHDITVAAWTLCQRAHDSKANLPALRRESAQVVRKLQRHEKREHEMARQALGNALRKEKP